MFLKQISLFFILCALVNCKVRNETAENANLATAKASVSRLVVRLSEELGKDTSKQTCDQFETEFANLIKNPQHAAVLASARDYTIFTPEDYEHKNSNQKIKLKAYTLTGKNFDPVKDIPIVFFNGGPGYSSHAAIKDFLDNIHWRQELANLSITFMDQRGNGCSDAYPKPQDSNAKNAYERMQNYGSREIVLDAEKFKEIIYGVDKKWRVFGQSYGSIVVHRYLEVAPNSIDSAFAHGSAIMNDPDEENYLRQRREGELFREFFQTYPASYKIFKKLKIFIDSNSGNRKVICTSEIDGICGYELFSQLGLIISFHDLWIDLDKTFQSSFVNGDGIANIDGLKDTIATLLRETKDSDSAGLVIDALEGYRMIPSVDNSECTPILQKFQRDKIDIEDYMQWPIVMCREYEQTLKLFSSAKIPRFTDSEAKEIDTLNKIVNSMPYSPVNLQTIQKNLAVDIKKNFYLYSSYQDAIAPLETFTQELANLDSLPNFIFTKDLFAGHGGFLLDPVIRTDVVTRNNAAKINCNCYLSCEDGVNIIKPDARIQALVVREKCEPLRRFNLTKNNDVTEDNWARIGKYNVKAAFSACQDLTQNLGNKWIAFAERCEQNLKN